MPLVRRNKPGGQQDGHEIPGTSWVVGVVGFTAEGEPWVLRCLAQAEGKRVYFWMRAPGEFRRVF